MSVFSGLQIYENTQHVRKERKQYVCEFRGCLGLIHLLVTIEYSAKSWLFIFYAFSSICLICGLFSGPWPSGGWPTLTSNNYCYFPSKCLAICFLYVWNIKEMDSQRFLCYPFAFFFNWITCALKQPFLHTRFVTIASVGIDRRLYFSFKHKKLPICW